MRFETGQEELAYQIGFEHGEESGSYLAIYDAIELIEDVFNKNNQRDVIIAILKSIPEKYGNKPPTDKNGKLI
jgi:hypothetical protein